MKKLSITVRIMLTQSLLKSWFVLFSSLLTFATIGELFRVGFAQFPIAGILIYLPICAVIATIPYMVGYVIQKTKVKCGDGEEEYDC